MAQLVIYAHDRIAGEFYRDARDYKRYDVIDVYPSGQQHSQTMLTLPCFRIVDIPSLSLAEAQTLLAPQVLSPGDGASEKTLAKRGFKMNMDDTRLPKGIVDFMNDDTRATPILTLNINITLARAIKVAKPKIADPANTAG